MMPIQRPNPPPDQIENAANKRQPQLLDVEKDVLILNPFPFGGPPEIHAAFSSVEVHEQSIALDAPGLLQKLLVIPDRLTLSEVIEQFRGAHDDFAVIMNEYSLVVGVITLNDVMSTVMGDLVSPWAEEQIVQREDGSWLIDGVTPIPDVLRALDLDELPRQGQYDTLAGFLMVMLRRIPRRTDCLVHAGWRFEVLDVDNHKIDQVLVTRLPVAP